MTNFSSFGITLPWCSDEYLYALKERFPERFGESTRQELFKALYENIDRESPDYEEDFDVAMKTYDLLHQPFPNTGVDGQAEHPSSDIFFQSEDPDLLHYLSIALPKIDAQKIYSIMVESVENLGSAYLVLGHFDPGSTFDLSGFAESKDIHHLSFVSDQGLGQCAPSFKENRPLLALSLVQGEDNFVTLDMHLIKRHSDGVKPHIQNKPIDFNQFVSLFNTAHLDI